MFCKIATDLLLLLLFQRYEWTDTYNLSYNWINQVVVRTENDIHFLSKTSDAEVWTSLNIEEKKPHSMNRTKES